MSSRNRRARGVFSLEPLEGRSAPSHVGLVAHALVHVHQAQPAAHVEKLSDRQVQEKAHPAESQSSADTSLDTSRDSSSSQSGATDKNSPDPSGHR